jgi:Ca2+:H+ antiporter
LTPLAVIALVVPKFTASGSGALTPVQAVGVSIIVVLFYVVFLAVQTSRHRSFFSQTPGSTVSGLVSGVAAAEPIDAGSDLAMHWALLFVVLFVVAMLAREISAVVDYGIHRTGLPAAAGGLLIASITLLPESVSAYRAALHDKLQHSVNVFLGSSLATIGLTVPCVLMLGLATDHPLVLGLKHSDMVLLSMTLFVSALTFGGVRTNVLQGAAHLLIFALYVLLVFAP